MAEREEAPYRDPYSLSILLIRFIQTLHPVIQYITSFQFY